MTATTHRTIPIRIDDREYHVSEPEFTGGQLKELGGVPAGYRLFLDLPGRDDRLVPDDEVVHLKPGAKFYSLPVGQVGGPLKERLEQEVAALQDEFPGLYVDEENGQRHVHVPALDLPSGVWSHDRVSIFLNLPPGFPSIAVPGFEADGQLRLRSGAQPAGSGFQAFHGQSWLHFCWNATNFDGTWRSIGQAIRFAARRFVEQPA